MGVEVEHVSWLGKVGESIKGLVVGLLLFAVSFPLLFWNEGRAVHRAQDLEAGGSAVVETDAGAIDPSLDGELVWLRGEAVASGTLADPLGPSASGALRLRRTVEMYQWREEERRRSRRSSGGGQRRTTTYRYEQGWSETPIDSSRFREAQGHANPPMPARSETVDAGAVTVGARTLTPDLVQQIDAFEALPVDPATLPAPSRFGRPAHPMAEGGVYLGADPQRPAIGDLRIRWAQVPAVEVSVLAAQRGEGFGDWDAPTGRRLEQNLEVGRVAAADMFGHLEASNEILTWALRFVGWLLCFLGLLLVFRPLVAVADLLPFAGSLVGAGTFLVSFALSVPLSLVTVAIGWIAYRPLLGIGLLAGAALVLAGVGFLAVKIGRSKNAERAAARAAAPATA